MRLVSLLRSLINTVCEYEGGSVATRYLAVGLVPLSPVGKRVEKGTLWWVKSNASKSNSAIVPM
jgi:hypothetical protein